MSDPADDLIRGAEAHLLAEEMQRTFLAWQRNDLKPLMRQLVEDYGVDPRNVVGEVVRLLETTAADLKRAIGDT